MKAWEHLSSRVVCRDTAGKKGTVSRRKGKKSSHAFQAGAAATRLLSKSNGVWSYLKWELMLSVDVYIYRRIYVWCNSCILYKCYKQFWNEYLRRNGLSCLILPHQALAVRQLAWFSWERLGGMFRNLSLNDRIDRKSISEVRGIYSQAVAKKMFSQQLFWT